MECRAEVRLYMSSDKDAKGFGKGMVMLLEGVSKYGSINKATQAMGMAYSKAWRMLNDAESEFGVELISRDGARGSEVTAEGKRLIRIYREMRAAANVTVADRMKKYAGNSVR